MPMCSVPGCTSGYASNPERLHFFKIPQNPTVARQWQDLIHRAESECKSKRYVCQNHFLKSQIMWQREHFDLTGKVYGVTTYKVPRLKPGTVPSLFPWDDMCTFVGAEAPAKSLLELPERSHEIPRLLSEEIASEELMLGPEDLAITEPSTINSIEVEACDTSISTAICHKADEAVSHEATNSSEHTFHVDWTKVTAEGLSIPSPWFVQHSDFEGTHLLSLAHLETIKIEEQYQMIATKLITVSSDSSVQINVYNRQLNPANYDLASRIQNVEILQDFVLSIDRLRLCTGVKIDREFQHMLCKTLIRDTGANYRHINCVGLLPNTTVCSFCRTAKKSFADKLRRWKKTENNETKTKTALPENRKEWSKLQAKCRKALRRKRQLLLSNKSTKVQLQELRLQTARLTRIDIEKIITDGNLGKNQMTVLKAIINSARRGNSKGQRYSEEWLLLCMLMHMRSATSYRFLRTNGILPLPTVKTIRRYLSKIDVSCGFDPQFFEVLKVALNKIDEFSRHGILLLDEMSTRESVSVDTKNLTYKGLINFGKEGEQSSDLTEKANHCLVLMYQSLNAAFTQPIAVFASRGPVKGDLLAKLIIKAVALMEGIGVKIHGVVSDGASCNRKCWKLLGIDASKNSLQSSFEHPTARGRRIYVFSDVPHLIKTIRNRLYERRVLQFGSEEPDIKWEYFEKLHDADVRSVGPGQALICPRLTKNHLCLNSSSKMRVRLATQVFSNSVAGGLHFYKSYERELKGCEATADFSKWINDMFDALNRTESSDGVTPGNADYKQIEESLRKLDAWEDRIEALNISKTLFLTKQTADGLRVSLKSMLDLITYLTKDCGFPYVLTGRINQDPLERFFGTVRQAGGCDDHPSTPTFLQIYKILSTYSVLKPPKKGNCSITSNEPSAPLVTLSELKAIYRHPKDSAIAVKNIKEKLNVIIQNEDWELENISEHDYCLPEVSNCVLYCLTADLLKRICSTIKCIACKNALIRPEASGVVLPESVLTQWQQRAGLVHPNSTLFGFILFLEKQFQEHCRSTHVFEQILEDVYGYKNLSFPCLEHGQEVILNLTQYFVRMRMQQYCTRLNAENEKINQLKKKNSKFCTT